MKPGCMNPYAVAFVEDAATNDGVVWTYISAEHMFRMWLVELYQADQDALSAVKGAITSPMLCCNVEGRFGYICCPSA